MIVAATYAPSNIRYPQDASLINEARENAERLLGAVHDPAEGKKPRTYCKHAWKDYLKYAKYRKHTAKMTCKAIGKQLSYLRRDLSVIDHRLSLGKPLTARQAERLDTLRTINEQQKYMYNHRTHSVPDRIVSISPSILLFQCSRKSRKTDRVWCKAGYQRCGWVDEVGVLLL